MTTPARSKCPGCGGTGGEGGRSPEGHWEFVCQVCEGVGEIHDAPPSPDGVKDGAVAELLESIRSVESTLRYLDDGFHDDDHAYKRLKDWAEWLRDKLYSALPALREAAGVREQLLEQARLDRAAQSALHDKHADALMRAESAEKRLAEAEALLVTAREHAAYWEKRWRDETGSDET